MNWELPPGGTGSLAERLGYLQAMTRWYDGERWLFLAAGTTGRSPRPLMAWWAVLYTLSVLARYQPHELATHIDGSRHAATVASLLKRAISIVPSLIAETSGQVARPD